MNMPKDEQSQEFPKIIKDLPEAEIQFEGVRAWILQGKKHQLVFFEMQPNAKVSEHSHNYPQWGMVVQGKMNLTINGKTKLCQKGDDYLIPAGAKHYATFLAKTKVIDLFSEKTRYKARKV